MEGALPVGRVGMGSYIALGPEGSPEGIHVALGPEGSSVGCPVGMGAHTHVGGGDYPPCKGYLEPFGSPPPPFPYLSPPLCGPAPPFDPAPLPPVWVGGPILGPVFGPD